MVMEFPSQIKLCLKLYLFIIFLHWSLWSDYLFNAFKSQAHTYWIWMISHSCRCLSPSVGNWMKNRSCFGFGIWFDTLVRRQCLCRFDAFVFAFLYELGWFCVPFRWICPLNHTHHNLNYLFSNIRHHVDSNLLPYDSPSGICKCCNCLDGTSAIINGVLYIDIYSNTDALFRISFKETTWMALSFRCYFNECVRIGKSLYGFESDEFYLMVVLIWNCIICYLESFRTILLVLFI